MATWDIRSKKASSLVIADSFALHLSIGQMANSLPMLLFNATLRTDSLSSYYNSSFEEYARSKRQHEEFSQANSGRRIPQVASTGGLNIYDQEKSRLERLVSFFHARFFHL